MYFLDLAEVNAFGFIEIFNLFSMVYFDTLLDFSFYDRQIFEAVTNEEVIDK